MLRLVRCELSKQRAQVIADGRIAIGSQLKTYFEHQQAQPVPDSFGKTIEQTQNAGRCGGPGSLPAVARYALVGCFLVLGTIGCNVQIGGN